MFGGITLRFGVVTTTANENGRALLWRDSLWKKRSEPGRNQEESGEKLLRKLMRSQVFKRFLEHHSGFSPENRAFNRAFAGVSPGFCPGFTPETPLSGVLF